jgi:hypothetical protein
MRNTGKWRIVEMDLWDRDAIDLIGPAFIEFGKDHSGCFRFIAVEGWMDCRETTREGRPPVELSWNGRDDCDDANGRGWVCCRKTGRSKVHLLPPRRRFRIARDTDRQRVEAEMTRPMNPPASLTAKPGGVASPLHRRTNPASVPTTNRRRELVAIP